MHGDLLDCRRSRAVAVKIGLVWLVSLLVTSPLIIIGFVRPEEIMSHSDLQCGITNRPFLVYGSIAAYFFPLGLMLVAYTASIRLLRQQGARLRSRRGSVPADGDGDPGNGLRRSRSGRRQISTTHSGIRTPEPYTCRLRRDDCASRSAAASVRSLRDRDDLLHQSSQRDRTLSPVSDDRVLSSTNWVCPPPSPVRTGSIRGRDRASTHSAAIEQSGAYQANDDNDIVGRRSCVDVGREVTSSGRRSSDDVCSRLLLPVNRKSRDMLTPPPSSETVRTASAEVVDDSSRPVDQVVSGHRFRSLVQKYSVTIQAASELISLRDDARQRSQVVATAAARVAAIRNVRTERKAARVIGAVFAVFVTCWTPFFTLNLALGVCGPPCRRAVDNVSGLYSVFLWLGYVASTLNPIVYTVFNSTFRRTFADLLTCRRSCSTRPPNYITSRIRRQQDFSI